VDTSKLIANIDGSDVADVASHRERSPVDFTLNVAADNSSGFPPERTPMRIPTATG
jgi:hypothetical protein